MQSRPEKTPVAGSAEVTEGAVGIDKNKLPGPPSDSGTEGTTSEEGSSDEEYWREVLQSLRTKAASKKTKGIVAPAPASPVEHPGPVPLSPVLATTPASAVVDPGVGAGPVASGSHDPAALPRAGRGDNTIVMRGREVRLLFNNATGERTWTGYSWQCLAYGVWADHKKYGGPLLIVCS